MDTPGSRILLRPGGRGRGGRLRHGVPGHGRLTGSGPLGDPGLVPISGPDANEDTGGIRIVMARILARPRTVTGDRSHDNRFRRQDDGPRAACSCG